MGLAAWRELCRAGVRPERRSELNIMLRRVLFSVVCLVLAASLLVPLVQGASPLSLGLDLSGGAMVTYRPDFDRVPEHNDHLPRAELLTMTKEALAGRLFHRFDTLPDVVVRGDDRIVVSLPGEHDQRKILETVGKTYRLTFRKALAQYDFEPASARGLVLPYEGRWLELGEELLSGDMLSPASIRVMTADGASMESFGRGASISFEFRPPHDERFAEITRESIGQTLAILLDDQVEWAGRVESEIRGPGSLHGGYGAEEAAEVAALLRSGDLPLSLDVEELSAVGPTLGQEMMTQGQKALAWSVALLAFLVLLAYGNRPALLVTGWVSLASLLFFTLGLISVFQLTVDLVAIAGLVLSIGMGMDAFILVFEAMETGRTEAARQGRSPLRRLREVYSFRGEGRALVHANATTLLVVLLLFASDRLKSFALFLIVGLAASVMTIFVTRALLSYFARRGWLEDQPADGRSWLGSWKGPWGWLRGSAPRLFRARPLYAVVLALFLLGGAAWVQMERPGSWWTLGADFQPGIQMQVALSPDQRIDPLVSELRASFPGVEARHQQWLDDSLADHEAGYLITLEGSEWEGDSTLTPSGLGDWLAVQGVELRGLHSIDARLSGRRILSSLSVLVLSFVLLGFYLGVVQRKIDGWLVSSSQSGNEPEAAGAWIFVGTVLAVLIDVMVALAALALLRIPIGMPVIAALLTIVGYSVNDSMVLWSYLSKPGARDEGKSPRERVTEVVDRILSRTVLTSLSTMVPAVTILIAGLEPLRGFAWAVLVGTFAGTLSSIFVVASFALRARSPRALPKSRLSVGSAR